MFDLIVVGAGPAGITAAVYAARKKIKTLVISPDIGGQAAWSGDIENYTGYQFISGPELAAKFEEHLRTYELALQENEEAQDLQKAGEVVQVRTTKDAYEARAVIVASGKKTRVLGVPGEKEFKNKGLTYCATCDGPLFAGKDVAVIGGGNSALDAAIQLIRLCPKVTIVNNAAAFTADALLQEQVVKSPKVRVLHQAQVSAILGDKFVTAIKVIKNGVEQEIPVKGVFVEIGLVPNTGFAGILAKNKYGEIIVDSFNRTNVAGVFAAGDVTDVPEKQIIIAAGEGAKAALAAFRYLAENKFL